MLGASQQGLSVPLFKTKGFGVRSGVRFGVVREAVFFYVLQAVKSFILRSNIPHMHMHLCFS